MWTPSAYTTLGQAGAVHARRLAPTVTVQESYDPQTQARDGRADDRLAVVERGRTTSPYGFFEPRCVQGRRAAAGVHNGPNRTAARPRTPSGFGYDYAKRLSGGVDRDRPSAPRQPRAGKQPRRLGGPKPVLADVDL